MPRMNDAVLAPELDLETRQFLQGLGIAEDAYLKRRAELAAQERLLDPKLAEDHARLQPVMDDCAAFIARHGLWNEGIEYP